MSCTSFLMGSAPKENGKPHHKSSDNGRSSSKKRRLRFVLNFKWRREVWEWCGVWRIVGTSYPQGRRQAAKGDEQTNSRRIYIHTSYKNKGSPQQRRDQQRASVFRPRQETTRVTKLLDAHGNKRVIRQHGNMGLIKHVNILAALEMRALRYHNKGHAKANKDEILYDEAMDKTGTIDTA